MSTTLTKWGIGHRHGMENTPTWMSWRAMVHRCCRTKDKDFPRYGGVGIRVCEYLKLSPINLMDAIGERPQNQTIDRVNNKGNYSCGACDECVRMGWPLNIRWATPRQQQQNRNISLSVNLGGEPVGLGELAEKRNMVYNTLLRRFKNGESLQNLLLKGRIKPVPPSHCKICSARLKEDRGERYRNFCSSKCFVTYYKK